MEREEMKCPVSGKDCVCSSVGFGPCGAPNEQEVSPPETCAAGCEQSTNQYCPWVELGISEADYWKRRYLEVSKQLHAAYEEWV